MGNLFAEAKLKTALANDTYTDKKEIVSKAGYLLGVDKNIFDSGELLSEIYEELEKNQDARMVRNLCFLFTCIEHCYKQLQMQMVNDLKNLHSMDMTKAATEALRKDGLDIVKANCTLDEYRPRIAAEIANRIQGCKDIFPMWVPWEYIRQMFSFPTKTKDRAQERAWLYYNENIIRFPYNVFLNWQFKADEGGNLLGSDEQFLIRLYAQNGDTFCDYDKVRGESKQTQQNVEQFLLHSVRSEILVDCENCDPLKFFAVLQSLSPEAIGKIQKIFLFDDVNASSIWGLVEHYTKAKVDRFMTQRVVEGKSVVDMTVAVCCCQEHYDKKIDSFLLFSSDSDYWPLINNVVTARFLMMFEREKTSKAIVNKMREHHVLYCYTDQFCKAGDAYRLRNDALALECASYLKQQLGSCNIEDKPEKEESEEKKPDGTAQESAQENPANRSADDYNYPDFCGRLYIPAAGIDVALYNNTSQDTCNRTDSAAIFPHRPEDGGSNIVADNELESLTSVAVGSTAYVITPGGQQINYVCVDAFNGHNDVTGYDALQKDDGTVVWGSAELIVYTCLGDAYNVRVACFNRA